MIGNCATAGTLENDFTRVLDRSQDTLGRSTAFQLKDGTTLENRADYSYTPTDGRLQSISGGGLQPPSPANTFTYNYLPNSHLIEKISGPIHDVNNTWEPTRNVLATKQNKVGTTVVSQYDYTVNAIGQRTNLATSGSAFANAPSWLWGYDSLGQVISADSNVNTSDRTYQYDTIGNRLQSGAGVSPAAITNYTANALNQYSQISNSQILNPSYDDDGNATAYPLPVAPTNNSALAWDGENRLVSTTVNGTTTTYLYDAQSRRICTQSPISNPQSTLYIYDGFNCIAEYSGTTLSKTRLWGIDLSGAPQGAGGVGGLLVEKQGSNLYCPLFDGNGNVSEYLAADGSIPVHFEYDSFGNTVVNTDSGNLFNYRFSTKPLDFTTGLYYYQYRYYDPLTGRWPSRDPIEERGGKNLYGFVGNRSTDLFDSLGHEAQEKILYYKLPNEGKPCTSMDAAIYKCNIRTLKINDEKSSAKGMSITMNATVDAITCKDKTFVWTTCYWGNSSEYFRHKDKEVWTQDIVYDKTAQAAEAIGMTLRLYWLECKCKDKEKNEWVWVRQEKDVSMDWKYNKDKKQWEPVDKSTHPFNP